MVARGASLLPRANDVGNINHAQIWACSTTRKSGHANLLSPNCLFLVGTRGFRQIRGTVKKLSPKVFWQHFPNDLNLCCGLVWAPGTLHSVDPGFSTGGGSWGEGVIVGHDQICRRLTIIITHTARWSRWHISRNSSFSGFENFDTNILTWMSLREKKLFASSKIIINVTNKMNLCGRLPGRIFSSTSWPPSET